MSTRVIQLDIFQAGFRDDNDAPVIGGSVEFYTADQTYTTVKNAYTTKNKDATLESVELNGNGAYPDGLYFDGATVYDFRLKDSAGATVRNYTNVKIPQNTQNTRIVTAASVNATIDDDFILCDTTSNAITVNLYPIANNVRSIVIKNIGASNAVTVDGDGAETIDGSATVVLSAGASQEYVSTGVEWSGVGISSGTGYTSLNLVAGDGVDFTESGGTTTVSTTEVLKSVIIEMGDWDMTGLTVLSVDHGLDPSTIRSVSAIIRNDADTIKYPIPTASSGGAAFESWIYNANATQVSLGRNSAGFFSTGTDFDSVGYNRGWITIWCST